MTERRTVKVRFLDMEIGDAGNAARTLREQIEDEVPDVDVSIQKDNPDTMDFGATLAVVLGTPTVIALATGIAKWMALERTSIEVEVGPERVVIKASGSVDENVARIVEAVQQSKSV
jgi:Effector Associated Constant Component 1